MAALVPGRRVGPYEILAPLGAGGMGEVYRARDSRLRRDVAVKVLPVEVSADPERIRRLTQEAHALAALNHPHILTIHEIGTDGDSPFVVSELLEGQTLQHVIAGGPLPLKKVVDFAIQIAEGLAAAHDKGIAHRDLKPSNIMLTKAGVKLLDFGLAKLHGSVRRAIDEGVTVTTVAAPRTAPGTVMGTFPYMSPEQIKGQDADTRTDIWSFGCVLHEMLTGRRAFEGSDEAMVMAAILERDPPPILASRPDAPPVLGRIVRRCLEKDPDERWRSAHDVCHALQWTAEDLAATKALGTPAHVRRRELVAWMVAAIAVVSAFVFRSGVASNAPEPLVTQLEVVTPATSDPASFALSRDGRQLLFVALTEGGSKLWLRPLDRSSAQPLAGTDGASYPFWSPDNRAVGFFAENRLKRLDLDGGVPQVLAEAPSPRGGTWSDDAIIFALSSGPLWKMPPSGGTPVAITRVEQTQHLSHRWPQVLPDGNRVLFFATQPVGTEPPATYVASIDGTNATRLVPTRGAAVYADPGYLLLVEQDVLVARQLQMDRAELGPPIPIAKPVGHDAGVARSAFSVSATGVLAHRPSASAPRQLAWMDRAGRMTRVGTPDDHDVANPALSPDGRRVALQRTFQGNTDVWVREVNRDVAMRLTLDQATDGWPTWSPDGERLVFRSNRSGPFDLYERAATGGGAERSVLSSAQLKTPVDWSKDGRYLLYQTVEGRTAYDLWAVPLTGDRQPFPVAQTRFEERNGQFAPDGRWVAYESNESGRPEVYLQAFPGSGGKSQVSIGGGTEPRWRPDGRELFYVAPDGTLMAVSVSSGGTSKSLDVGSATRLFRVATRGSGSSPGGYLRQQYAVAPDGQRFLVIVAAEEAAAPAITIVLNWISGLKK